jgi:hypothetical protein
MNNLKSKILKVEKAWGQIPVASYTKEQLLALEPAKWVELMDEMSDEQLDWILDSGGPEQRAWLDSLSDEELEAVIKGDLKPPLDYCQQW